MELVRGWKVLIEDIEIKNETENVISPFIRFTLGGNFHVGSFFYEYFLSL